MIVGRSRDTEIRVYEGEIEQLQSAESAGIGVRVIRDHRQGFAYAGTLDDDVLGRGARRRPRQRRLRRPRRRHRPGRARRACRTPTSTCTGRPSTSFPTDRKVDLALELERAVRGADPRISGHGVLRLRRRRRRVGHRHHDRHPGDEPRRPSPTCPPTPSPPTATRPRPATGSRSGASRPSSTSSSARPRSPIGPRGCSARPSRRRRGRTVVLDPFVTAQFLGILGFALVGRERAEGPVALRRPRRRGGGGAAGHPRRRPDRPGRLHRHGGRRRGARHPAHTARRRRRAPGLPAQHLHRAPTGHGVDGLGGAGLLVDARRRLPRPRDRSRRHGRRPSSSPASTTACSSSRSPVCTLASTRSAATSRPAPRACGSRAASSARRSRSSRSPRRCSGCCTTSGPSAPTSPGSRCRPPASPSSSATSPSRDVIVVAEAELRLRTCSAAAFGRHARVLGGGASCGAQLGAPPPDPRRPVAAV